MLVCDLVDQMADAKVESRVYWLADLKVASLVDS